MKRIISTALLALSFGSVATAQISEGGEPISFEYRLDKQHPLPPSATAVVSQPNLSQLALEDQQNTLKSKPYRVAVNLPVALNPNNSGHWYQLPDGAKIWRLHIKAKHAQALSLYYGKAIWLPEGGKMFLYNGNKKQIIGAYTAEINNEVNTIFATEMIEGADTYVEYYQPPHANKSPIIEIASVGYYYRGVEDHIKHYASDPAQFKAQSCEVNVACSEANAWQDQVDAAIHYTFTQGNSTFVCSGALVNNSDADCTPYLLTADHCGEKTTSSGFNSNVWYFNYQNPNCAAGTTSQYQKPSSTMTGAIFRASSRNGSHTAGNNQVAGSDFTLVELNSAPPTSYNVYYAGWDRRNTAATSGVSIHHPAGHDKKISTFTSSLSSATYNGGLSSAHWEVVWAATSNGHGVTEGGSSGSPIFNQSKRIVGDLSGGSSFCTSPFSSDLYGKFSVSWDQLGSSANAQLKAWLDPSGTGVQFLDGTRPPCTVTPPTGCASAVTSFPYTEDFESGTGTWAQATGDDLNWTSQTGGTPSSNTGPGGAHQGSRYLYIEASSPNYPSKTARLLSPCFDLNSTTSPELSFWYNMNGAAMGSLTVDVSTNSGTSWTTGVWSISGNQGAAWSEGTVDLSAYSNSTIQLRFTGTTGTSYTSDIAIDAVEISNGTVTPPSGCNTTIASFPYNEGFEGGATGAWTQATGDDLNWTNQSGGTPSGNTGPSGAQEGSRYLYIEASSPNYPAKSAQLVSPCFNLAGVSNPALTFYAHMYGTAMGSLTVEVSTNNGTSYTSLGSISGNQGNSWQQYNVDLSAYSGATIQLRMSGLTGTSYTSDISIDALRIAGSTTTLTYCTPAPSNGTGDGDYIDGVALGSISNLNSGSNGGPAYVNNTSMSTSLNRNSSHNLTVVEGGYAPDRYAAWIDYNQDGDFTDSGEKLGEFTGTVVGSSHTIAFSVPSNAALGSTRMRVRCLYNGNANGVDPCADGDYGETEDYTVNITVSTSSAMAKEAESTAFEVQLFPNPTHGEVQLQFTVVEQSQYTLNIYDALGRIVAQEQSTLEAGSQQRTLSLSQLPAGTYTAVVQLGAARTIQRIVLLK